MIQLQVVVTIFLGSQAPAVMSRDLRFRVASLYFSRPLSRRQYVQAKYAAMAVALFILMALPHHAAVRRRAAGGAAARATSCPTTSAAMAGAAIYALVLAGIGLVGRGDDPAPRAGRGRGGRRAARAVRHPGHGGELAEEFGNDTFAGYTGLISPFTLVDGVVDRTVRSRVRRSARRRPGAVGTAVFVAVTVLLVVGCYAALLARYRKALS